MRHHLHDWVREAAPVGVDHRPDQRVWARSPGERVAESAHVIVHFGTVSGAPDPYDPDPRRIYDVRPLLRALQTISDAGRRRKESGVDDEAVKYARLAFKAIDFVKADERGDVDMKLRLVDEIWDAEL